MATSGRSLAAQFLRLQLVGAFVVVAVAAAMMTWSSRQTQVGRAEVRTKNVARAVALAPITVRDLRAGAPSPELTAFAEQTGRATETDFVVVMDRSRTRYTHPVADRVGRTFVGDVGGAMAGKDFTESYKGTLGQSIRTVVPVSDGGEVIGMVAVGVTVDRITAAMPRQFLMLGVLTLILAGIGTVQAMVLNRRLARTTHGMNEVELGHMYEYHDAVLHAVREGLVLLDPGGVITLVNDEACRLLNLARDPTGRSFADLGLPPALTAAPGDERYPDRLVVVGPRTIVVNHQEARHGRTMVGSVVTMRDHTELQKITGELATVRSLAATLRAQNHESTSRLHTVVSLIELDRPRHALLLATQRLQTTYLVADGFRPVDDEPVLDAVLLGKAAQAAERDIDLVVDPDSRTDGAPVRADEIVTVVGNLLDNAFDAVASCDYRRVDLLIESDEASFAMEIEDSGPGLAAGARESMFERGWTTKADPEGHGLGLALVHDIVTRYNGTIVCGSSPLGGARFEVRLEKAP
jgi:two-component system, CitB family, sensor kinase